MDLLDDSPAASNQPEFTVSELSGAVKRVIEGEFGLVRVRGEVGRVSRPASGHLYFALKDDRASLDAVSWKGQVAKMQVRPEEGMEVIATGRMTTFPGQSKYQLIVDDVAPAGVGALMAMLEKRRTMLAAEGLFDAARKQPIPYLPQVIGVVTSPSGAVIRDILHRLRDRFPRHVLIWPVAVQGQNCAADVAGAIAGFNALPAGGDIPRPDVIIVARGGGSLEDLWGFNEEIVVRAAANSAIPLISAVGHETDTTLIDYAADLRAPTPTAAAELAVPVRADLIAWADGMGARMSQALATGMGQRGQRLRDLSRALPRAERLLDGPLQRYDSAVPRLGGALGLMAARKSASFGRIAARLQSGALAALVSRKAERLAALSARLDARARADVQQRRAALGAVSARLPNALARMIQDSARKVADGRTALGGLGARLDAAPPAQLERLAQRLGALERMRLTLGPTETLARGFAIVRSEGRVVTSSAMASAAATLEIEFADGRAHIARADNAKAEFAKTELAKTELGAAKKPAKPIIGQGSLF
jgi:exodeoxyribonuclease VII large subunit